MWSNILIRILNIQVKILQLIDFFIKYWSDTPIYINKQQMKSVARLHFWTIIVFPLKESRGN